MNEIIWVEGAPLTVRAIELCDVEHLARLFGRLSRESVRLRFFSPISRVPRPTLLRLSDVYHFRRDALVALDGDEIVGVARYGKSLAPREHEAELAVTIEDAWQHRGLGRLLTQRLAAVAAERGFETFVARILPENRAARALLRSLAPDAVVRFDGGDYEARVPFTTAHAVAAG